jgi:hypothetical protein
MVEDFMIGIGKMVGMRENGFTKTIGFLWVGVWFSWSLRFIVAFQPSSYFEDFVIPSLGEWVMGGKGVGGVLGRLERAL